MIPPPTSLKCFPLWQPTTYYKTLLHGGSANIYVCDTQTADGCLNPSTQTHCVPNAGLQTQVAHLFQDMGDKILTDTALTQEEIGLLQATRLPIYKMLNVQSAFVSDKQIFDIISYADVIATDILFQYLDENLSIIHTSTNSLQFPESIMAPFEQGISQARTSVRAAQQYASHKSPSPAN